LVIKVGGDRATNSNLPRKPRLSTVGMDCP